MNRRGALFGLVLFVVAFAAMSCERGPATYRPRTEPVTPTDKKIDDLAILATGKPPSASEHAHARTELAEGRLTIEGYIDHLLMQPALGRVARHVILGPVDVKKRHPVAVHSVLRQAGSGNDTIYYLRRPCDAADSVSVRPWWAPDETVQICPDAYRPDVNGDSKGRTCGASPLAPGVNRTCGCGPYLMHCTASTEHHRSVLDSLRAEIDDTVAYLVNNDRRLDELFTGNATVHNRDVELVYRRARVLAGETVELLEMKRVSDKPRLTTRFEQHPGQHAGILTAPALVYSSDALRGVMRNFYDYLWCSGQSSSRVTTQAVLALGKVDLREGDGWRDLAKMPICTDCHARLDYGMQFFWGYPSSTEGIDFRPDRVRSGLGKLFGNHIDDYRGEEQLTPAGFAKLALAQEDFTRCMSRKIVDHVWSGHASESDVDAVMQTFVDTRRFRAAMRTALLRFAASADSAPATAEPAAPPPKALEGDPSAPIEVSTAFREEMDLQCNACHNAGESIALTGRTFERDVAAKMLEALAFGTMPKDQTLDAPVRARLIEELVFLLWHDEEARAQAREFFMSGMLAHPVHRMHAMFSAIEERVNAEELKKLRHVEVAVRQPFNRLSPGFAMATGMTALAACKEASADDLAQCVTDLSDPATYVIGAP